METSPCSSLVEDQRLQLPFLPYSPSSPSLDMEAALQQLNRSCEPPDMASTSESSSSSEDSDVLMVDPFLDYINEVLMEEGMEDATFMQQEADASYRAIISSFYEIIGKQSLTDSSADSTGYEDKSDLHAEHRISAYYEDHLDERHVRASEHNGGFMSMTNEVQKVGVPSVSMPAKGIINQSSHSGGEEQGNGHLKVPSEDEEVALKDLGVSFEELELYVGEPSLSGTSTRAARCSRQNGDKKQVMGAAGRGSRTSGNKGTPAVQGFVDLREGLVSCAQSVAVGDTRMAHEILQGLRLVHGASAKGSGLQRIAHYFSEALVARMRGTGGDQFRVMTCNMPSSAALLKTSRLGLEVAPYLKIMHYFANQSILKAAEGSSRLHIVDYGSNFGMQWPFLINSLADRKGGPPLLVITAIEFLQLSHNPAQILEDSGRRLAAYARIYNVPFQFHAIVTSEWGDHDAVSLHLHEDEVLVLNCMKGLRHLADESVDLASNTSPRQKILTFMRNLNPHLLLFADLSAAYSSPFFASRFREALYFYSNLFDMLDILWDDSPERLIVERSCCYRDIVNIVACEGAERVERLETYKQWQACIKRAGFAQLPFPPTILSRSRSYLKQHYHKDFMLYDDANGWLLVGWKGRANIALSAWKPSRMYQ
eukprot:c25328_g1_i4 orf=629-2587(-)